MSDNNDLDLTDLGGGESPAKAESPASDLELTDLDGGESPAAAEPPAGDLELAAKAANGALSG